MLELRLRDGYVMTKGDRDKLRAELAGKAMAALIGDSSRIQSVIASMSEHGMSQGQVYAADAVEIADALMAELGIKGEE